jgi:hypothetical protein
MRSPRYLYLKRSFIFSYKIGSILLLLWSFSNKLPAESYSNYLLDDFKANEDWGRVKVLTRTRIEALAPDAKEGFSTQYQIFTGGLFRAQRGGNTIDEASKYTSVAAGNASLGFSYNSSIHNFAFVVGPKLSASESRVFDRQRNSVWDAEAIGLYGIKLTKTKISAEGGRGWQRLDGFGFLFNGMANYGQLQFSLLDTFSLAFHSLTFKPQEESLSPNAWNYERKEITGVALRSNPFFFWENLQIFHYQYKEPGFSKRPSEIPPTYEYGYFLYSGFEFRSQKFWEHTSVDVSFIRINGNRSKSSSPWSEIKQSTTSTLAYASIHGHLSPVLWGVSGLFTSKDATSRTDNESNGYAAPLAEPRVLGGYASFLLYQSVYFPNDRVFYEFQDKRMPGFENKGQRIVGLQFGYHFDFKIRGDVFFNRASSEMGNGTEVILKITKSFDSALNGFLAGSVCYATVNPNRKVVVISEPFTEDQKQKDFVRFYVSAGFQF